MKNRVLLYIIFFILIFNAIQSVVYSEDMEENVGVSGISAENEAVSQAAPLLPAAENASVVSSISDDFSDPTADLSAMGWTAENMNPADSMSIDSGTGALCFVRGVQGAGAAQISRILNLNKADKYIIEYRFKITGTNSFDSLGSVDTYSLAGSEAAGNISTFANGADPNTKTLNMQYKDSAGNVQSSSHGQISSLGIDNGWIKVKYVVNAKTDRFSAYVNDKIDTSLNLENTRFKFSDDVDTLKKITFNVAAVPVTAAGTLYIDYLKAYSVNDIVPPNNNYLLYENFDNLPNGYIPTLGVDGWKITYSNKKSSSNDYYPNSATDSVTVQNGVLQMMKGAYPGTGTSNVTAVKVLDPNLFPATGRLIMQWDINIKRNSMYNTVFPSFDAVDKNGKTAAGIVQTLFYTDKYMAKYYNGPTKDLITGVGKADASGYAAGSNSDKWHTVKYVIDLDKYLFDAYVYDRATSSLLRSYTDLPFNLLPTEDITLDKLTQFSFIIGESSTIPDSVPPGIYLLDNIGMYYESTGSSLTLNNIRPANGSQNIPVNPEFSMSFDRPLNTETINSANITVTKADGSPVSGYIVTPVGNNQIKVSFSTPLQPLTAYYINTTGNIAGADGSRLSTPSTYTFTTAAANAVLDTFNTVPLNSDVSTVPGWTVNISNPSDGDSATVVSDSGAIALRMRKTDKTLDSTLSVTRSNPFTAPGKYVVEFYSRVYNFRQSFDGFPIIGAQKNGVDMSIPLGLTNSTPGHYLISREDGNADRLDIISDWGGYPYMWHHIKYVIDTQTDTFSCFLDGTLLDSRGTLSIPLDMSFATSAGRIDIDGLKDITFRVKTTAQGSGTTDFFIDNLAIYPVADDLTVCASNPANLSVGADAAAGIDLIFSRNLIASSVTQSLFTISSEDGDMVNITGVELRSVSGQRRIVHISTSQLMPGTKYTLQLAPGAADMSGAKMAAPYSLEFTTSGTKPAPESLYDKFDKTADGQLPKEWTIDRTGAMPQDEIAVYGGALKIHKSNTALNSKISISRANPINTNGVKTAVEFKARFESHGQSLEKFPSIKGYKGNATPFDIAWGCSSGNVYGAHCENGSNDFTSLISNLTSDPDRWYSIKYVIDPTTDRCDIYIDGSSTPSWMYLPFAVSGSQPLDTDGTGDVGFTVRCTDTNSPEEIIWLDDFRIYKVIDDLSISGVTPADASENNGVDAVWQAVFARPLNPVSVNKSNFTVIDDASNNVDFSISIGADSKTVTLTFFSMLKNNAVYTVRVKKAVCDNNSSSMAADETFTFKTDNRVPGTIVLDTFDDKAAGYVLSNADGWYSSMGSKAEGDAASIEDDPTNPGNKALRLIKKDTVLDSNYNLSRRFEGAEFGKILVRYKMRVENHVQYLTNGGSATGYKYTSGGTKSGGMSAVPAMSYQNTFLFKVEDGKVGGADVFTIINNLNADHSKWYDIQYIINTETDTFDLYLDGTLLKAGCAFSVNSTTPMDIDGISELNFGVKCSAQGSGDSIYWFDDITVRKLLPLTVSATYPSQNSTDVELNPSVNLYFNLPINPSTVTKQNIKVLKGDTELPADSYNVSLEKSGATDSRLNVTFNKTLDYKSVYKIKIDKALTSAGDMPSGLASDYILSFTTRAPSFDVQYVQLTDLSNNPVSALGDMKGQTVKVRISIKNIDLPADQSYAVTIALVDGNGAMRYGKCFMGILPIGNETMLEADVDIPAAADNSYKVQCFVWNSYTTMKKLYPYIVKP